MNKKSTYIYNSWRNARSIASALLLVFVAYYANVSLFPHRHVVDGVTIVHSHIHTDHHSANDNDQSHTSTELTLISHLSNFVAEAQDSHIELCSEWVEYHPSFTESVERLSVAPSCALPQLRAPPAEA